MKRKLSVVLSTVLGMVTFIQAQQPDTANKSYLGFDRNDYPGDTELPALRQTFRYAGFWLNNPPGEAANSWKGKRPLLLKNHFGFLVLFNGRMDRALKGQDASALGIADGKAAVEAARKEGFASHVLIFLDQEEGGRLLPEQLAYILAWAATVRQTGALPGVYCSGIEVPEGTGTISTARDLRAHADARSLALWVINDKCPPSGGCAITSMAPGQNGENDAIVWQFAVSPRRQQFSQGCPKNADPDGNCYVPGIAKGSSSFVDLNTALSPDPSGGAR